MKHRVSRFARYRHHRDHAFNEVFLDEVRLPADYSLAT